MTISMIGIDHDRAPVDIRALFAFTKKNAGEAMEKLKETAGIHGCIILSTCNRLEIWASHEDDQELLFTSAFASLKIYRMILMNLILFQEQTVRL